jgi:CDP-diacylglycerol--glycerol-3-phosphate 3-phosphatidyltransferase
MILPNQLTVARIILTPVFIYLFLSDDLTLNLISVFVFVIAALTDWYDGWLARKFNYITEWGKFLDPLADKILTSTAFIGFVVIDWIPLWMVVIIIIRDFLTTLFRVIAEWKGWNFATSYVAKIKTFVQMAFLYFLVFVYFLDKLQVSYPQIEGIVRVLSNGDFRYWTMLVITLLTLYTLLDYFLYNKEFFKKLFIREAE